MCEDLWYRIYLKASTMGLITHIFRLQLHCVISVAEKISRNLLNATNFACWLVCFASIIVFLIDNWLSFQIQKQKPYYVQENPKTERDYLGRVHYVIWPA